MNAATGMGLKGMGMKNVEFTGRRFTGRTISDIREELRAAKAEELPSFIEKYEADGRSGAAKLVDQAKKQLEELERERQRIEGLRVYERKYASCGLICGVDEAGRGPLAGPVAAGAVILPEGCRIFHINDSKKLSPKRREELYEIIMEQAVAVGVGMASPRRIDEVNILQATYEAMREAIENLAVKPDILLNDAVTIPGVEIRQVPIVKGDAKSITIGAASIVAKVTRDRLMGEYDALYPEYGFAAHKGYGTAAHIAAIQKYGPSPIHRRTFIQHFIDPV